MNKYQEALDRVKSIEAYTGCIDEPVFDKNDIDIKLLQELVDRATPMKPCEYESQSGESYECKKCGYPLPIYADGEYFMDGQGCMNNYCRFCGQELVENK